MINKKAVTPSPRKSLREWFSDAMFQLSIRLRKKKICEKESVYIVWDALGDGRLAGVFHNFSDVEKMLKINPHYYRFYKCHINKVFPDAIGWLDDKQKKELEVAFRLKLD